MWSVPGGPTQVRSEDKRKILDEERASELYHTVAQLLFFMSRVRKDTKTAISFLCTQVKILEEYKWGNLVQVLRYIRGNLHLPPIMRDYIMSAIKWRVNPYFSAHTKCKGHTGAMMSMGSGSIMETSWKKKLNVRSSTDAKMGGSYDAVSQCL